LKAFCRRRPRRPLTTPPGTRSPAKWPARRALWPEDQAGVSRPTPTMRYLFDSLAMRGGPHQSAIVRGYGGPASRPHRRPRQCRLNPSRVLHELTAVGDTTTIAGSVGAPHGARTLRVIQFLLSHTLDSLLARIATAGSCAADGGLTGWLKCAARQGAERAGVLIKDARELTHLEATVTRRPGFGCGPPLSSPAAGAQTRSAGADFRGPSRPSVHLIQ